MKIIIIFGAKGNKTVDSGINAEILDSMFLNPTWLYSVKIKRDVIEVENQEIVFIQFDDMGLNQ